MANFPEDDPEATREFLHRQMNEEVNSLEISARNLADFPEADWELRLAMARQCADEARHVVMFRRCFEARGGQVGQYPILNFQYRILMGIATLVGRLAVQNRSFEAAGIDAIHQGIADAALHRQDDLAELLDAQLADEIQHVRYANRWVEELVRRGGPRAGFDLAKAVAHANQALAAVAGGAMVRYPVAEDVRREAGFSQGEIETVKGFPERL